jgi:hypothetical protein
MGVSFRHLVLKRDFNLIHSPTLQQPDWRVRPLYRGDFIYNFLEKYTRYGAVFPGGDSTPVLMLRAECSLFTLFTTIFSWRGLSGKNGTKKCYDPQIDDELKHGDRQRAMVIFSLLFGRTEQACHPQSIEGVRSPSQRAF